MDSSPGHGRARRGSVSDSPGRQPPRGREHAESGVAAILFLYRHVVGKDLGSLNAVRARRPKRLPTMLSKDEVRRLIAAMPEKGAHGLIVELLYGTGMRISECCQLRVCDLDFDRGQILIRGGKGNKDRATVLPRSLEERLKAQLEFVRLRHERDVEKGAGYAPAPTSLEHRVVERKRGEGGGGGGGGGGGRVGRGRGGGAPDVNDLGGL